MNLLGKSDRFRIHDVLFWNSLWNCTGTAKNPRQAVEKWTELHCPLFHSHYYYYCYPSAPGLLLWSAYYILREDISNYFSPGQRVIPKENYQDSAPCRTPKVQYI